MKKTSIAWTVVSNFLDPVTKQKVVLLGSDYKTLLPQYIDLKNLPVEYGGTCICGQGGNGSCVNTPGYLEEGREPPECPYTKAAHRLSVDSTAESANPDALRSGGKSISRYASVSSVLVNLLKK